MSDFTLDYSSVAALKASRAGRSPEEVVTALKVQKDDIWRYRTLQEIVYQHNPELLRTALEGLSAEQRIDVLLAKDALGVGALYWAINERPIKKCAEMLEIAFEGLSAEQRVAMLMFRHGRRIGSTLRCLANTNEPELMGNIIAGFFPNDLPVLDGMMKKIKKTNSKLYDKVTSLVSPHNIKGQNAMRPKPKFVVNP